MYNIILHCIVCILVPATPLLLFYVFRLFSCCFIFFHLIFPQHIFLFVPLFTLCNFHLFYFPLLILVSSFLCLCVDFLYSCFPVFLLVSLLLPLALDAFFCLNFTKPQSAAGHSHGVPLSSEPHATACNLAVEFRP